MPIGNTDTTRYHTLATGTEVQPAYHYTTVGLNILWKALCTKEVRCSTLHNTHTQMRFNTGLCWTQTINYYSSCHTHTERVHSSSVAVCPTNTRSGCPMTTQLWLSDWLNPQTQSLTRTCCGTWDSARYKDSVYYNWPKTIWDFTQTL